MPATADDSPIVQKTQQSDATQSQSNKIAAVDTNFVFYPETNFVNASDTQTNNGDEHELETRLK